MIHFTVRIFYLIYFFFYLTNSALAQTLNYYYGNIHAHTAYSDGNQEGNVSYDCPSESYQYAKRSQHFDFLGISEHNHNSSGNPGMTLAKYAPGLSEANYQNQDGTFVCMYGMEWGVISGGGHVIIYGVNELIGWESGNYDTYNAKSDYDGLFKKISRYSNPQAFAYLAHPDTADYNNLFKSAYNSTYDSAIVGAAIFSGPAFSKDTTYSSGSTWSYEPRYKEALSLGYHLGAGLDHDNHYTTFGRMAQSRLVVLAPSLTRDNIMDGIKKMRTYSSDDWNVKVNFTINGQPLGSVFSASGNPTISVSVTDPDGEGTYKIFLCGGVPGSGVLSTTLTSVTNTSTLTYVPPVTNGSTYYYYVQVRQSDFDRVYTSPIWFTRNDIVLPIELLSFKAAQENDVIKLKWQTASEMNNDYFTIESSSDGIHFDDIGRINAAGNSTNLKSYEYIDTLTNKYYENKTFYYRLKQTDYNQNFTYSNIESVNFQLQNNISNILVYPMPIKEITNLTFSAKTKSKIKIILSNMMGETIFQQIQLINNGTNHITIQFPKWEKGIYSLRLYDDKNSNIFNCIITNCSE